MSKIVTELNSRNCACGQEEIQGKSSHAKSDLSETPLYLLSIQVPVHAITIH